MTQFKSMNAYWEPTLVATISDQTYKLNQMREDINKLKEDVKDLMGRNEQMNRERAADKAEIKRLKEGRKSIGEKVDPEVGSG